MNILVRFCLFQNHLAVVLSHFSTGTSVRTLAHFGQLAMGGENYSLIVLEQLPPGQEQLRHCTASSPDNCPQKHCRKIFFWTIVL